MNDDERNRASPLAIMVFTAGDRRFNAADIVDAAWFRGELQPLWREFLAGRAGERRAEDEGLMPDSEGLQTLSNEVRYQHELITAEETEAWLTLRNLSLDDLTNYTHRRYWRERAAPPSQTADAEYPDATPEQREMFIGDLMFGGNFDELTRRLTWRLAAPFATGPTDPIFSDRLEVERSRFVQQVASDNATLAERLGRLGRNGSWLESQIELEAAFGWSCEQVCTPKNRARTLAILRLGLTHFEVELIDLESADALREACFCLTSDGLSMEELAAQEHCRVERRGILLEEFPEGQQQQFLSAQTGQVLPLITPDERFQVCRILNKREPDLADEKVRARIDEELIAAHFDNLVSKHIVWLIRPNASA